MQPNTQPNLQLRPVFAENFGKLVRGRPYNPRTLALWELDGRGPPVTRVGRDVLYDWDAAIEWLREQRKTAA